jgi:hypothetical protein
MRKYNAKMDSNTQYREMKPCVVQFRTIPYLSVELFKIAKDTMITVGFFKDALSNALAP